MGINLLILHNNPCPSLEPTVQRISEVLEENNDSDDSEGFTPPATNDANSWHVSQSKMDNIFLYCRFLIKAFDL